MKVKEVIVVEGRDDTVAIKRAVDADTIETNGSAINESTLPVVKDNEITIEDFSKVELHVAEVIQAEPVEGADRLLKIQLDVGFEKRQVVSGIAKYYEPQELVIFDRCNNTLI